MVTLHLVSALPGANLCPCYAAGAGQLHVAKQQGSTAALQHAPAACAVSLSMPTCSSVYARLTAVVDLPTPPLQLDTAITCFTRCSPPGRPAAGQVIGCAVEMEVWGSVGHG